MMIINLTQHAATEQQIDAGVVDVQARGRLADLLTIPVGGNLGIAANPTAAAEFLDARAVMIIEEFVRKEVQARACEFLRIGGYECNGPEALQILRPEVAAMGLQAMVGGAPYLVERLIPALRRLGVTPVYALSDRESVETTDEEGNVRKTMVFRHLGFIEAA